MNSIPSSDQGFSLLEVLTSLVLLSVASAGILPAFLFQFNQMTQNEIRSSAYAAAQRVLDGIRIQNPSSLPGSGSGSPQTLVISGKTFTVTTDYCEDPSLCTDVNTRFITIRVSHNGITRYELDTLYTQLR